MNRKADATWNGDLENGSGRLGVESGAFEGPYSFSSRFEDGSGTNPEELLAAAAAGCYSMALALALTQAGHKPDSVNTEASVSLDKTDAGFRITRIALKTRARVSGIDASEFNRLAESTRTGCIVSQALSAVPIELDASNDSGDQ